MASVFKRIVPLLILLLAACVPTTPPAQLAHTPEAPFTIVDGVVNTSTYSVRYPTGWEAVTGMDGTVVFSSPDGKYFALLLSENLELQPTPPPGGDFSIRAKGRNGWLPGNKLTVVMFGFVPDGEDEIIDPIYREIYQSIVFRSTAPQAEDTGCPYPYYLC